MFKCDKCGRVTEPREKQTKKTILARGKVYQTVVKSAYKEELRTSYGEEIIKEINLCEKCAAKD